MLTFAKQLQMWLQVHRNDEGATAVEYGLMVALIAGVIVVAVFTLGSHLSTLFGSTTGKVDQGNTLMGGADPWSLMAGPSRPLGRRRPRRFFS